MKIERSLALVVVITSSLVLSACQTPGSRADTPKRPSATSTVNNTNNSAAIAIRAQADDAMAKGDIAKANRLLDRALRVAPNDPKNYLALALLRLEQQRPDDARAFAEKGLTLNPDPQTRKQLDGVLKQIEVKQAWVQSTDQPVLKS